MMKVSVKPPSMAMTIRIGLDEAVGELVAALERHAAVTEARPEVELRARTTACGHGDDADDDGRSQEASEAIHAARLAPSGAFWAYLGRNETVRRR